VKAQLLHTSRGDGGCAARCGVYDLTDWIEAHSGGAEHVEGLCGTDAAAAFESQRDGQEVPEDQLAEFEIGSLED